MAAEGNATFAQPRLPTVARAARRRVVEEPMLLLLRGQASESDAVRMIGHHERLLAVQDRRIGAVGAVEAIDLRCAPVNRRWLVPAKAGAGPPVRRCALAA